MSKSIKIIGAHTTKFGELWDLSLQDLLFEAIDGAVNNASQIAKIKPDDIDAIYLGNMAGGSFAGQRHLGALASSWFASHAQNKKYPPAFRLESACASGSMAILAGEQALLSGQYQMVLVVGAEKMTDVSVEKTTNILSSASHYEQEFGSTFPALYALLAKAYAKRYQINNDSLRQYLSAVAVKNHLHGFSNPQAQFHKKFTIEQISNSQLVSDPLRLLDCSPVSDGASAVVLTTKKLPYLAKIIGTGHGQDSLDLASRDNLFSLKATRHAGQLAYSQAQIQPKDIDFAEVHDCFTIAELLASEDLGFFPLGKAGEAVLQGKADFINPSGGLKACGHPVGATGVKQIAFLAHLLAEKEKFTRALAHNVGGSGATAIVHILEN